MANRSQASIAARHRSWPGEMFSWICQFLISLIWGDHIGPVLKALTECEISSNVIAELNEADLRKLFKGGYRTAPLLKAADESGLIRSGMDPAKISFLMRAISGGGSSLVSPLYGSCGSCPSMHPFQCPSMHP